uniref:Uncharacterized protein n=1 Tax=Moniliophthora roreri TaxID=221103 RepID=A0A0W0G0Y1_MONRR
MDPDSAREPGG